MFRYPYMFLSTILSLYTSSFAIGASSSSEYFYDQNGKLTRISTASGDYHFRYDLAGNRTLTFVGSLEESGDRPPFYAEFSGPRDQEQDVEASEVSFSWQLSQTSGMTVDLYLSQSPEPQLIARSLTSDRFTAQNLITGSIYYWQAVVIGLDGKVAHKTPIYSFKTKNNSPTQFRLISPKNDARTLYSNIKLTWEKSIDPDPQDTVSYDVYLGTKDSVNLVKQDLRTTSFTPDLPTFQESIHWQVVAKDSRGGETKSPIFTFNPLGTSGDDQINGSDDDDILWSKEGNDVVYGEKGNDRIYGGSGDDTLNGGPGDDRLHGDIGEDSLRGGAGNDQYIVEVGHGFTVIHNEQSEEDIDKLVLGQGFMSSNIQLQRSDSDLWLYLKDTNERIKLTNFFSGLSYQMDQIVFSDGTTWTYQDIISHLTQGDRSDNSLAGDDGDNVIHGGPGHDILKGYKGNDTYLFHLGDGVDTIEFYKEDGQITTLEFGPNIDPNSIRFKEVKGALEISIAGTNDKVIVAGHYLVDQRSITRIVFANGTIWENEELWNQILTGSDGDEKIVGNAKDNRIIGGPGNDILKGQQGSDEYLFNLGDGVDEIYEYQDGLSNKLVLGADIVEEKVHLTVKNDDLIVNIIGSNDLVILKNFMRSSWAEQFSILFEDGTSWDADEIFARICTGTNGDDVLVGNDKDNTFLGGLGNDHLTGRGGTNTYIFRKGDGQDVLDINAQGIHHTLKFAEGITQQDLVFSRQSMDLKINLASSSDQVIIKSFFYEYIREMVTILLVDETKLSYTNVMDQLLAGTDGADRMMGDERANVFLGSKGNDHIEGGRGDDQYEFNLGDGLDSIELNKRSGDFHQVILGQGIKPDDIYIYRSSQDLILAVLETNDRLTLMNFFGWSQNAKIDEIVFKNGTIWSQEYLSSNAKENPPSIDNKVVASDENPISGGPGLDFLEGHYGDDTYRYQIGDGQDTIRSVHRDSDIDVLMFSEGITQDIVGVSREDNHLLLSVNGAQDVVKVEGYFDSSYRRLDKVIFPSGASWTHEDIVQMSMLGNHEDNVIRGSSGDDLLRGGKGSDKIIGGSGNDTYIFHQGDGQDTYNVNSYGNGQSTIQFGPEVIPENLRFRRDENDFVIMFIGSSDRIILEDLSYDRHNSLAGFQFDDGDFWDFDKIKSQANTGDDRPNHIIGTNYDDIFDGGKGNDTLVGKRGKNTYNYHLGDGQDTIDNRSSSQDLDILHLGEGISKNQVSLVREKDDLLVRFDDPGDRVRILKFFSYEGNRVQLTFEDGSSLDYQDVISLVTTGTNNDDTLLGDLSNNTLKGGIGQDLLKGGGGDDVYLFHLGDGYDVIDNSGYGRSAAEGSLIFGENIHATDIRFEKDDNDLMIFVGANDRLKVLDYFSGYIGSRLAQIIFDNGQTLTFNDVVHLVNQGDSKDNRLIGSKLDDRFVGSTGYDYLEGKEGQDTYVFERGDGVDTINNYSNDDLPDTIVFGSNITPSDIIASKEGYNLKLQIANSHDIIIVEKHFNYHTYEIDSILFSDGTIWNQDEINNHLKP